MTDDVQEEPKATPAAAEHAAEVGVDLTEVEGSGAEGRILKEDVEAANPRTVARVLAGEKMPASGRPGESGDPGIQQLIANRHSHVMMGDTAAARAIDEQLKALGYTVEK